MGHFAAMVIALLAGLALVGWLADRRADGGDKTVTPGLTLLPGDIKYESSDGKVRVYFPIVTSIVLSVVLTVLLRLFGK